MAKHLIVIAGATATGKTSMAIELAKRFDTEILSADSRQFYREMTIGTAKPTEEELASAKHHFINSLSVKDDYSVGDFEKDALRVLDKIYESKDVAIMAGGSGLFIRAVCEGLDKFPEVPKKIKADLESLFRANGIESLQTELAQTDPDYYKIVDQQNPVRLQRALSVIRASGKPFSSFLNQPKPKRDFHPIYILLEMPREKLYQKINHRVDKMMETGLLKEVESLLPFGKFQSLQTVGYQELISYFNQELSLERAIELIKQNSRRYAKRQMTWFRKREHWKAFESGDVSGVVEQVMRERF